MFLRNLNEESRKKYLELAYKIATYDGEFADAEQELMEAYKSETGIQKIEDSLEIPELIEYFSKESEQVQKIVWYELWSMINVDYKITIEEEEISRLVREKFTIPEEKIKDIEEIVNLIHRDYKLVLNALFQE